MSAAGPGARRAVRAHPRARGAVRARPGYSLVEVVVALVLLQVGLLGAAGMVVTASRAVAGAARTDRALVIAGSVADSLQAFGWGGGGERIEGAFVVRWSGGPGGWSVVEVWGRPEGGSGGELVVRLPVPVGAP